MANDSLEKDLETIKKYVNNPKLGLPEELFLYITTVTPMINVDLLVKNDNGQILMSWRDDLCGSGWHIPGGIIRYKETLHDRLLKVGESELNTEIRHDESPLLINQVILDQDVRGHFISLLYKCYLPDGYEINNHGLKEGEAGFLKWIDKCPDNLVMGQREIYKDLWNI